MNKSGSGKTEMVLYILEDTKKRIRDGSLKLTDLEVSRQLAAHSVRWNWVLTLKATEDPLEGLSSEIEFSELLK